MTARQKTCFITLIALCLLLLPAGLLAGGVSIPPAEVFKALWGGSSDSIYNYIVLETRLPALLTAFFCCASLGVAGLLMQTCFNNPLAGPSIMGISSGASVGVALVMLLPFGFAAFWGKIAITAGALAGALLVLVLLMFFSGVVRSADILLIVGILIGYLASSSITILNYFSTDQAIHNYVSWGFGSFAMVTKDELWIFCSICLLLIACSELYSKSLNAILFGNDFASNVGVNVAKVRTGVLFLSGLLTAIATAFCGPISFVGMVAPHIARMSAATSNHHIVLPLTALCGGAIGLLCQTASVAPALGHGSAMPVNAITPLVGVPIILYVLLNRKKLLYFN